MLGLLQEARRHFASEEPHLVEKVGEVSRERLDDQLLDAGVAVLADLVGDHGCVPVQSGRRVCAINASADPGLQAAGQRARRLWRSEGIASSSNAATAECIAPAAASRSGSIRAATAAPS